MHTALSSLHVILLGYVGPERVEECVGLYPVGDDQEGEVPGDDPEGFEPPPPKDHPPPLIRQLLLSIEATLRSETKEFLYQLHSLSRF